MKSVDSKDVLIIGAGPAGLSSATNLGREGHNVTLIRPPLLAGPRSIYTTETPTTLSLTDTDTRVLPYIRVVTSAGADYQVATPGRQYYMLDNRAVMQRSWQDLEENFPNVRTHVLPKRTIKGISVTETPDRLSVGIDGERRQFDYIVDCSGTDAEMVSKVDPARMNERWLGEYLLGASFKGQLDNEEMILVFGPAAGTSWVCPGIEPGMIDVVYSAWGDMHYYKNTFLAESTKRLQVLKNFMDTVPGVSFETDVPQQRYCGVIRSHISPKPLTDRVIAVGESAGMAVPGTGDSWRFSEKGGKLVSASITKGETAGDFHRRWTGQWGSGFIMAGVFARIKDQATGNIGGIANLVDRWIREESGTGLIEDVERFFVDRKISPGFAMRLMQEPTTRSMFFRTLATWVGIKTLGPGSFIPETPLPKLN